MSRFIRKVQQLRWPACSLAAVVSVDAKDRRECDRDYKPQVGQAGKDVVWVPTPDEIVQRMLRMAKVTPQDTVMPRCRRWKNCNRGREVGCHGGRHRIQPRYGEAAQCYVRGGLTGKTRIIKAMCETSARPRS